MSKANPTPYEEARRNIDRIIAELETELKRMEARKCTLQDPTPTT